MNNEGTSKRLFTETQERAEAVDYTSPLSEQLLLALKSGSGEEGLETLNSLLDDEKKLGQLDSSTRELLRSILTDNESNSYVETRAFLLSLLGRPSPAEQRKVIEANKEYLEKENAQRIKEDLATYLQLKYALDQAETDEAWDNLLGFYKALTESEQEASRHLIKSITQKMVAAGMTKRTLGAIALLTPEERSEVGCDLKGICEKAIRHRWIIELLAFLRDLSPEERQSLQPRFGQVIDHAAKNGYRETVIEVFGAMTVKERQGNSDLVLTSAEEIYKQHGIEKLLVFYGVLTPGERASLQKYVKTAINLGENNGKWEALLDFYAKLTESEKEALEDHIDKAILGAEKYERGGIGLTRYYLSLPEDDRFYLIDNLKATLHNTPRSVLYPYHQIQGILTPLVQFTDEEKQELRDEINSIVNDIRKEFYQAAKRERPRQYAFDGLDINRDGTDILANGECLLLYYNHLSSEERLEIGEEIENVLQEMEKNDDWPELLSYYSNLPPEEQAQLNDHIQNAINHLQIRENSHDVLTYFAQLPPDSRRVTSAAIPIGNRILTTLKSNIGDVGLRANYCGLIAQQLLSPESSLVALQALIPRDKLALVTGLESLGVEVLPILSWQLSAEQIQALLPIVARLANQQKGTLLEGLILPFRPRGQETAGFEDKLIDWLHHLEFLAGLGSMLGADVSLTEHVNRLRKLQEQAGITSSTRELSFDFIRTVLAEVNTLEIATVEQFKQLFQLERLTFTDIQRFIESWNGEIESLIVLSQRFIQKEPDVIKCLARAVGAAVRGQYTQERYNLDNRTAEKQLTPLIRGASSPEEVIKAYHEGVYQLYTVEQGEERRSSDIFIAPEHIRTRLTENLTTHNHLNELFALPELSNLPDEAQTKLKTYLCGPLVTAEENTMKTPNQLKEFCQEYQVPNEFQVAFIRIRQFMQDLFSEQKTAVRLRQSLDRLIESLPATLQSVSALTSDLGEFVSSELAANESTERQLMRRKKFLIHTTDHPKTLLEIGKYPLNSGSCQSYDYSDENLVRSLPGYVSDAHIQAIVIRELHETADDDIEIVDMDEGKRTLTVRNSAGIEKKMSMSRPKARAMIFLGDKDNEGVLFRQVSYQEPGQIDPDLANKLEGEVLAKFANKLKEFNPSIRTAEKDEKDISIAGSHNVGGHYNDLQGGQAGQGGTSYMLRS